MVVFEKAIVQSTDISLYVTRMRFDGDQAGLHKPVIVSDGVHRRHHSIDGACDYGYDAYLERFEELVSQYVKR